MTFSNPYSELTQVYYISCSIITYDSALQKYSKIFHQPGDRTYALGMQVERSPNLATSPKEILITIHAKNDFQIKFYDIYLREIL